MSLKKGEPPAKVARGRGEPPPGPLRRAGWYLAGCQNEDRSLSNPLLNESLEPVPVNASMSKT